MAIKIDWKNLYNRTYNWQNVQKVILNGEHIWGSDVLDFVNNANTWAYWKSWSTAWHWYEPWEWYYCINQSPNNYGAELMLPTEIQGEWIISNVHLWYYSSGSNRGIWLAWFRDNFTKEDIIRYPNESSRNLAFYVNSSRVENIYMSDAWFWESEMDINFDYGNWRIYGNINWMSYATTRLSKEDVSHWQSSWESKELGIQFSLWGSSWQRFYIRKVLINTI